MNSLGKPVSRQQLIDVLLLVIETIGSLNSAILTSRDLKDMEFYDHVRNCTRIQSALLDKVKDLINDD